MKGDTSTKTNKYPNNMLEVWVRLSSNPNTNLQITLRSQLLSDIYCNLNCTQNNKKDSAFKIKNLFLSAI